MDNLLWLASQAWSVVTHFWPISLAVLVPLLIALGLSRHVILHIRRRAFLLLISPLLAPLFILIWASALRHTDPHGTAPMWPQHVLYGSLIAMLPLAAFVVWRSVGHRWLALSVSLVALWLCLCSAFVATMSLSNDWL